MSEEATEAQAPRVPEPEALPDATLRDWMSSIGRKGGKSRSQAKLDAIAANLTKAQAARWAGRGKVTEA